MPLILPLTKGTSLIRTELNYLTSTLNALNHRSHQRTPLQLGHNYLAVSTPNAFNPPSPPPTPTPTPRTHQRTPNEDRISW